MSATLQTITLQVRCIRKRNRTSPHERIEGIGGVDAAGQRYYYRENDAILRIESGRNKFWTTADGKSVWVVVASYNGGKYLKTEPDGYAPNNLLALPECP